MVHPMTKPAQRRVLWGTHHRGDSSHPGEETGVTQKQATSVVKKHQSKAVYDWLGRSITDEERVDIRGKIQKAIHTR